MTVVAPRRPSLTPGVARTLILVAAGAACLVQRGEGQAIAFSQPASVSQNLGPTELSIRYSRPTARGRVLFGGVVRWGRLWNPGADSATTLATSTSIRVEGESLPAGRYSLWVLPDSSGPWTIVFSRAHAVFHSPYPGEEHDVLRVSVAPQAGEHMETLAFYFPVVRGFEGVMRLHWGTTILPLRITAER